MFHSPERAARSGGVAVSTTTRLTAQVVSDVTQVTEFSTARTRLHLS
jgi:hypothetical protein